MKKFEIPEIEIIRFTLEDVLTVSSGEDELPIEPFKIQKP